MKKVHYYFGWFNGTTPEQVAESLHRDIPSKKSLVIINTVPSEYEDNDEMVCFTKNTWFEPAGLIFDKYHSIDYRINKEGAKELLRNASAILLHGGHPDSLKDFLAEYELAEAIRESSAAVVMGASAGGMNMSAKFVYGKRIDDDNSESCKIYDGLGFNNFALVSHALCDIETLAENENTRNNLLPLSQSIDVYVACEESTIRIKDGRFEVMGDVYLISKSKIQKVKESAFIS